MIFNTPECGQSMNTIKINDFQVLVLAPFWVSSWKYFGSPNGGQGHQKATSTKAIKQIIPKTNPNWSQRGSQNGSKISSGRGALGIFIEIPKAPRKIPKAPRKIPRAPPSRAPPGSILERFWDHFGTIFVSFSDIVLVIFASTRELSRNSFSLRAILH